MYDQQREAVIGHPLFCHIGNPCRIFYVIKASKLATMRTSRSGRLCYASARAQKCAASAHLFQILVHAAERIFLEAGDLCLRDMDFIGNFNLCLPFKKAQLDDPFIPLI